MVIGNERRKNGLNVTKPHNFNLFQLKEIFRELTSNCDKKKKRINRQKVLDMFKACVSENRLVKSTWVCNFNMEKKKRQQRGAPTTAKNVVMLEKQLLTV